MQRGSTIGPYVLIERLGRGAMGVVWLARHPELGHLYAVKVLSRRLVADKTALARFEIEMESLGRVDGHPGIVRVHSAGRTRKGLPYFAMEYVSGRPFSQAIKEGISLLDALDVVEQVATALAHAHSKGLVHRDVKPDNVLLGDDGIARLSDFGLSKLLDRQQELTKSTDLVGTPFYLAPEQASSKFGRVGPHSDVYAVGTMLYEVLCGSLPHSGRSSVEVCRKVMNDPVVPPSQRSEGVPEHLEALCLKALGRRPEQRFPSGRELAAALRSARLADGLPPRHVSGEGPLPPPEPAPLTPAPPVNWLLRGLAALALVSVGLTFGAVYLVQSRRQARIAVASEIVSDAKSLERQLALAKDLVALREKGQALQERAAKGAAESPELFAAALAEVERVVGRIKIERASQAFAMGDVAAAWTALEGEAPAYDAAEPPELGLLLLLAGRPGEALQGKRLEGRARALAGAWAGRAEVAVTALTTLDPGEAQLLRLRLREWLPSLKPGAPAELAEPWRQLVLAETSLARGELARAAVQFSAARRVVEGGVPSPSAQVALLLGQARLALARGEPDDAFAFAVEARSAAADRLDAAQALAMATAAGRASGRERSLPDGQSVDERLALEAPGHPLWQVLSAGDVTGHGSGPLGQARASAREGQRAVAIARLRERLADSAVWPDAGFVALERLACAEGRDGAAGLLLARGFALARLALRGGTRQAAYKAVSLLESARPLRADSPALWVGLSEARRVLHQAPEALEAAERACALAPGDPLALASRARALAASLAADAQALLSEETSGAGLAWRERLARVEASVAESLDESLLQQLRGGWGEVAEALRAAREAGGRDRLERSLRLEGAQALLQRAALAADGVDYDAAARIAEELEPLLATVDAAALASARRELQEALVSAEPAALKAAEDALLSARPAVPAEVERDVVEALWLANAAGLPDAAVGAQAGLALAGDLPARALWHCDAGLNRGGAAGEADLERAAQLAPTLPLLVLLSEYLSGLAGRGAEPYRALSGVVLRSPEYAAVVPWLLGISRRQDDGGIELEALAEASSRWGVQAELALSLALLERDPGLREVNVGWGPRGGEGGERDDYSWRALGHAVRASQLEPDCVGAYALQTVALYHQGRGEEPDLLPEQDYVTTACRAGAPWSGTGALVELSLARGDALEAKLDRALALGYARKPGKLATFRSPGRGRDLYNILRRLSRMLEGLAQDSPEDLLDHAQELEKSGRAPLTALTLRLRAGQRQEDRRRLVRILAGEDDEAAADAERALKNWLGEPTLEGRQVSEVLESLASGEPGWAALADFLRRPQPRTALALVALSRPAGELRRWSGERQRALGRSLPLHDRSENRLRFLQSFQPDAEVWVATAERYLTSRARRTLAEAEQEPDARQRLLLEAAQEASTTQSQLGWLVEQGELGELTLALERAVAFALRADPGQAVYELLQELRALAAAHPHRRRALLERGLALLRRAQLAYGEPGALRHLAPDLLLDLAGCLGEDDDRRAQLVEEARAAQEGATRYGLHRDIDHPLVRAYRAARVAVAADSPASADACRRLDEVLQKESRWVPFLRLWTRGDPWASRLRERPELGDRFLENDL